MPIPKLDDNDNRPPLNVSIPWPPVPAQASAWEAGTNYDFVSRFFAPSTGVDEDPVTGSAHTTLTPYWSQKLNKTKLTAAQLSRRGGVLYCEDKGDRVIIGGKATQYLKGNIFI